MALNVMFLMRVNPLCGPLVGLSPENRDYARAILGPKKVETFRDRPFQWSKLWVWPHQNHYAQGRFNQRCKGGIMYMSCLSVCPSLRPVVGSSVCTSIGPSVCSSVPLFVRPSVPLSVRPFVRINHRVINRVVNYVHEHPLLGWHFLR